MTKQHKKGFFNTPAVLPHSRLIPYIGIIGNAVSPEKAASAPSAVSSQAPVADPFLLPDVEVSDVMNGVRIEKIGKWACIHMKKADAKAALGEVFSQFAADGIGYNWWSMRKSETKKPPYPGGINHRETGGTHEICGILAEKPGGRPRRTH